MQVCTRRLASQSNNLGGEEMGLWSTPVSVVEANLLNNDVYKQVPDGGGERGEGIAAVIPSKFYHRVLGQVEQEANNQHVEEDPAKSFLVHLPVYL